MEFVAIYVGLLCFRFLCFVVFVFVGDLHGLFNDLSFLKVTVAIYMVLKFFPIETVATNVFFVFKQFCSVSAWL